MVVDIKMCRFDNVPWGFRLVGGSDFEFPLTVVKVTEASIAEEAGLRAGDVIVRVNDTATSPLTHDEVNNIIRHCGNVFYLGVQREDEEPTEPLRHFPILGLEAQRTTPDSFLLDAGSPCKSPVSATFSEERDFRPETPERPYSALSENTEIKLVEEEIAAVLSGESEVLKEHNVMGILPKPGVCMTSDVLRALNEEAIKTKAAKDKENRKWTTFLQKPNRPIPKSKAQIEAERRAANAYKVQITKSVPRAPEEKKQANAELEPPLVTPSSEPTAPTESTNNEISATTAVTENSAESNTEKTDETPELPTPTDSEVPNLEESITETLAAESKEISAEVAAENAENEVQEIEGTEEQNQSPTENGEHSPLDLKQAAPPKATKTEEELALERQLADVQRQLVALSSLPSTIQSTLDAVTKQLADLLPAFKLQEKMPPRSLQLEQIDEATDGSVKAAENKTEEVEPEQTTATESSESDENKESDASIEDNTSNITAIEQITDSNDQEVEAFNSEPSSESTKMKDTQNGEQQKLKKQKRHEVIEELEEHLNRKKNPKRSKRAFGPLTPSSERPVVLPGGRRWYRPKDAYNDEFIAEILSSQAELITGHTLGYESPYLAYDPRVNFMKYQKPEKKIDLNRSEVYKIIHHLDRKPVRGIEVRPSKVAAEADIRSAMQS